MAEEFTACACDACKNACENNPGWFLPPDAKLAIEAGHAKNMMRDWLEPCSQLENDSRIYILAPASTGCEGRDAPEIDFIDFLSIAMSGTPFTKGRCVMLDKKRRCKLHTTDHKPAQCKSSMLCDTPNTMTLLDNYDVARHWDTDEGREVVESWYKALAAEQ